MRLHDLRHSAASDALMRGVHLAVVGKILGHKNPSTTARYAHVSDTVLSEAVETMAAAIVRNGQAREVGHTVHDPGHAAALS
ncbi:MAG: tyrosine-type recombinase/integrase [Nannocystaceae bacterium]